MKFGLQRKIRICNELLIPAKKKNLGIYFHSGIITPKLKTNMRFKHLLQSTINEWYVESCTVLIYKRVITEIHKFNLYQCVLQYILLIQLCTVPDVSNNK